MINEYKLLKYNELILICIKNVIMYISCNSAGGGGMDLLIFHSYNSANLGLGCVAIGTSFIIWVW